MSKRKKASEEVIPPALAKAWKADIQRRYTLAWKEACSPSLWDGFKPDPEDNRPFVDDVELKKP